MAPDIEPVAATRRTTECSSEPNYGIIANSRRQHAHFRVASRQLARNSDMSGVDKTGTDWTTVKASLLTVRPEGAIYQ